MRPSFINFAGDPFNSDTISEFPRQQSDGYSGTHDNLVAPSAANFPPDTPTRYFLYLPFVPDTTDLAGARPMLIKDVTGGTPLTRVAGAPGVNQYRVAPDDSKTPHIIELNSGQAGNTIAYDFYVIGSVMNAEDADHTRDRVAAGTIMMNGSSDVPDGFLHCDGASVLINSYPVLYAAIGTNFGQADPTRFNLPDFRGLFPRGQDEGAGIDPNAGTRTAPTTGANAGDAIGSKQEDELESHRHISNPNNAYDPSTPLYTYLKTETGKYSSAPSVIYSSLTGGLETRPKNLSVRFIIKY